MPNMSYCRFENTYSDLRDCLDALENLDDPNTESLSRTEKYKAIGMIDLCRRYIETAEEAFGEDEIDAHYDRD